MSEIYIHMSIWKLNVWLFAINLRYRDFTQETKCCTSLLQTAVRAHDTVKTYYIAIKLCRVSFRWYTLLCVINLNLRYH